MDKYDHFPHRIIHRVIQEKRSKFWKVIVRTIGRKKKDSYKRVSDFEELTREKYLNAVRNGLLSYFSDALDYCLWDCMKGEVYKINVDTRGELLAHISEAAAGIKKCKAELIQNK